MATNYPVNPRVRAFGKARIDIARRASSQDDWQKLWKRPAYSFPFAWGDAWKQCIEYKVDDFAAEVGFFIDVLGLPINAFDPDYAMFTSPHGDFFFAVVPALEGHSTPPDALRLQFMVADIFETTAELEQRGIAFESPPAPVNSGSALHIAWFRTPHGICVDLWGMLQQPVKATPALSVADDADDNDDDVFLPARDDPDLFSIQDAAPLIQPHRQSALSDLTAEDDEEFAEDEETEDAELDDSHGDDEDKLDDEDDVKYVDIDTA